MFIYSALLPSSPSSYIYFYIMYYPFYIFIAGSSSRWSHHLAFGLLLQSTGRTARFMDFAADQLVGLLGARFFANQLVGLPVASSLATLGLAS